MLHGLMAYVPCSCHIIIVCWLSSAGDLCFLFFFCFLNILTIIALAVMMYGNMTWKKLVTLVYHGRL